MDVDTDESVKSTEPQIFDQNYGKSSLSLERTFEKEYLLQGYSVPDEDDGIEHIETITNHDWVVDTTLPEGWKRRPLIEHSNQRKRGSMVVTKYQYLSPEQVIFNSRKEIMAYMDSYTSISNQDQIHKLFLEYEQENNLDNDQSQLDIQSDPMTNLSKDDILEEHVIIDGEKDEAINEDDQNVEAMDVVEEEDEMFENEDEQVDDQDGLVNDVQFEQNEESMDEENQSFYYDAIENQSMYYDAVTYELEEEDNDDIDIVSSILEDILENIESSANQSKEKKETEKENIQSDALIQIMSIPIGPKISIKLSNFEMQSMMFSTFPTPSKSVMEDICDDTDMTPKDVKWTFLKLRHKFNHIKGGEVSKEDVNEMINTAKSHYKKDDILEL